MIAAIHQPHYLPWLGYFDKMAKADVFVLLDEVQLEKGSQMLRNRVLDENGGIRYLTISADTSNFLNRQYRDLPVKDGSCFVKQRNMLENYYRHAPYCREMLPLMDEFLSRGYATACQWTCASIMLLRELLGIETPLVYQSALEYDREKKRSELVYAICRSVGADTYLSGRGGSMRYLQRESFSTGGVKIVFQNFSQPAYSQMKSPVFAPGVSTLDMLFNCGTEQTRRIFWENVKSAGYSPE